MSESEAVGLADRGAVDLITPTVAGDLLNPGAVIDHRARTSSSLAAQYHLYQAPILDGFVFNTRRPLFRDARLRLAVDYALDRRALAAAFADGPTDQIVPPADPGYKAGQIFPLSPDVAAARRLAGGRRRRAVVDVCGDPRGPTLAGIVRADLARIRMTVSVLECPASGDAGASNRADLVLVSGFPNLESDSRDPVQALDQALGFGFNGSPLPPGPWDGRAFRTRLAQARPLRGAARVGAYRRLAGELTRTGPLAIFGSWVWPEYFSPKVGCKVFQGEYGVADLGALCKRS
jgi:ABC-type transport system substrate-binding protein